MEGFGRKPLVFVQGGAIKGRMKDGNVWALGGWSMCFQKVDKKQRILKEFQRIPGVGKSIAGNLWQIGLRSLVDLKQACPELFYERLCFKQGRRVDRCVLYVMRCAVYFASTENPEPELLKWWHWKEAVKAQCL